jgi:hypothetical protein
VGAEADYLRGIFIPHLETEGPELGLRQIRGDSRDPDLAGLGGLEAGGVGGNGLLVPGHVVHGPGHHQPPVGGHRLDLVLD